MLIFCYLRLVFERKIALNVSKPTNSHFSAPFVFYLQWLRTANEIYKLLRAEELYVILDGAVTASDS